MSEFFENAARIAAEKQRAEAAGLAHEARLAREKQAMLELSHQRALEFIGIMKEYNVPQIPLCIEGDYYPVPRAEQRKLNREKRKLKSWGERSFAQRELERAQGHKLAVIAVGWVAAERYLVDADWQRYAPGIFVAEDGTTYDADDYAESRGTVYINPVYYHGTLQVSNNGEARPNLTALASDDVPARIGEKLVELGIVK